LFIVKNAIDLLKFKSKRIIYWFIISLANFIEELESHGFYCSCLDFDSILIEEEQIFKFTNLLNIFKMKHCPDKEKKAESELINCTDNRVSYLLDTAKPLLLEARTQP